MLIWSRSTKFTLFFVQNIEFENKAIDQIIKDTVVFNLVEKQDKRKKHYSAFDLIPTTKQLFSSGQEYEYRIKLLCFIAASDDARNYFYLLNECSLLQVYETIMLRKALNYELYN